MGLMGLARRAGAARGAYMADMEMYNRGRQEMLDQIARDKAAQESAFLRQRMGFAANAEQRAAAAEQRAQTAFDHNQSWLAKLRANTEQSWKNAEADRALKLKNDAEDREQKRIEQKYKNSGLEDQDYLNSLKIEEAENRLNSYNKLTPEQQAMVNYPGLVRMAAINAKASGGSGKNAKPKPPISDTILKANAEAVTPDRMKMAFGRKFYDTDANIQKRTGMSRDEFMKTLADQYKAHVLSARENAMDEDDFIRQQAEQYGFWDKHDLGRLSNAMQDKSTRHGFGFFGFGRRNAEEEYARRNPAFYKQQKQLIGEIDNGVKAFTGKNDAVLAGSIKTNKDSVRIFDAFRKRGLSAGDAAIYAVLHDYAKRNNLDANSMIDYFKGNPTRTRNFINFVRQNGVDAALSKFNTPNFARR